MSSPTEDLISTLDLHPLDVCNGFFRETWRDEHCTVIYWLLPSDHYAAPHVAKHPEIFTYHGGAPLSLTTLDQAGNLVEHTLGPDVQAGQQPHLVVPGDVWQAARSLGDHTLSSVVVTPPFSPEIVSVADVEDLCRSHPQHADRLRALSTPPA